MSDLSGVIEGSTRLAAETKSAYLRCVQRFTAFAGTDPAGWTPMAVEEWRDTLARRLKPQTVNKHMYALRYASARLEALGLGADFARAAETVPRGAIDERDACSRQEVAALLATCDYSPIGIRDRAAIRLALGTGLRRGNLVGARWEDLDGRRIRAVQKGNRPVAPVLDDRALEALGRWRGTLADYRAPAARKGPMWWAFRPATLERPLKLGHAITSPQWLNHMLAQRSELAELGRKIHPHLFRHTLTSWLLEEGVSPARIMRQTGHASMASFSGYVTDLEAEEDPVGNYLPDL